jgi:formylglycine-generating enzyme required for sulfatase activity
VDGDDQPAVNVTHRAATDFAAWLSRLPPRGRGALRTYRLPSEAEWEYACRARTSTRFWWGDDEADGHRHANAYDAVADETLPFGPGGWEHGDDGLATVAVGRYPPNRWYLHDMLGNVFEWCADAYHPSYAGAPRDGRAWTHEDEPRRVLRGGSWGSPPRWTRAAFRACAPASERSDEVGVRFAASVPGP